MVVFVNCKMHCVRLFALQQLLCTPYRKHTIIGQCLRHKLYVYMTIKSDKYHFLTICRLSQTYLCLSLSICLSVSLSILFPLSFSPSLPSPLSLSLSIYIYISLSLSITLPFSLSGSLSLPLLLSLPLSLSPASTGSNAYVFLYTFLADACSHPLLIQTCPRHSRSRAWQYYIQRLNATLL